MGAGVVGAADGYSVPPGSAVGDFVGARVGAGVGPRAPQSAQSVPRSQRAKLDPGPPSSQSPSLGWLQLFEHESVGDGVEGNALGNGVVGDDGHVVGHLVGNLDG